MLALLAGSLLLGVRPAHAADFGVTNTNDGGPGTLRQAILDANARDGADTIAFDIAGPGAKTVAPSSPLPRITSPLTVDATTQPGYAGKPLVVLDGASAGAHAFGFEVWGGNSTIRGLVINGFDHSAIAISGGEGTVVEACYLGTDASGTLPKGNGGGVTINDSASNTIGGREPGQGNVISGNEGNGVNIEGDLGQNVIVGNLIGTDATGAARLGNRYSGVRLSVGVRGTSVGGNVVSDNGRGVELFGYPNDPLRNNSISGNLIGTDKTGTKNLGNASYGVSISGANFTDVIGNTVAHNSASGVAVLYASDGARISQNSVYANGPDDPDGLGIDLGGDGVTPNDPEDADAGPNGLQNSPTLSTVRTSGETTVVRGTLDSTPNTAFGIEFFSSPTADSSGYGEGRVPLHPMVTNVTTDGSGESSFAYTTEEAVPAGHVVSATATPNDQVNGTLSTSEFSEAAVVEDATDPDTSISSGPPVLTGRTTASFAFASSEPGSRFQCSLDGAVFGACSSPKAYSNLSGETHTFRVRALDAAGNLDPTPAAKTWTVDTTKPTVSGMSPKPGTRVRDATPTITAVVRDDLTDLRKASVRLLVGGTKIHGSRLSYDADTDILSATPPRLSAGGKIVKVIATDEVGNSASRSWSFTVTR